MASLRSLVDSLDVALAIFALFIMNRASRELCAYAQPDVCAGLCDEERRGRESSLLSLALH